MKPDCPLLCGFFGRGAPRHQDVLGLVLTRTSCPRPPSPQTPAGRPCRRLGKGLPHGSPFERARGSGLRLDRSPSPPPPPLCDIPSGCCFFTGPWTVTRSSLRMLRRVAAFCRPLRPVLLLASFPRLRSPVEPAEPTPLPHPKLNFFHAQCAAPKPIYGRMAGSVRPVSPAWRAMLCAAHAAAPPPHTHTMRTRQHPQTPCGWHDDRQARGVGRPRQAHNDIMNMQQLTEAWRLSKKK